MIVNAAILASQQQKILKKLEIAVHALQMLDAGYGGMFGNQSISYEEDAIETGYKIVSEALNEIGKLD